MRLRKLAISLSRQTYTPVPFWIGLRLLDLIKWVRAYNVLTEENNRKPSR